jgi:glycosyltransferase involved in cell wall biosynthesis
LANIKRKFGEKIMKLCIFPNDPIFAYYKKGELKDRYYNPKDVFDELHIISFTKNDIEEKRVQKIAGNAKLFIHSVGKINFLNKHIRKNQIIKIVKNIEPDIIRSYNALLEGWVAAHCSKKLKIPLYVSLHVQYDNKRNFEKSKNYKKFLILKIYRKNIEPFTLKTAKKITIVYKIIEPYVNEFTNQKPEILYNRIDLKRFSQGKKNQNFDKPLIISVGRLTSRKNHDCLIQSIKDLDVYLQIIGDGEEYDNLVNLVKELKIEEKVKFIKSVPNSEIQNYYKSADIFVSPYNSEIEGLPIPVLEAMATGLPIIISEPVKGLSDGLDDTVIFSKINPKLLSEKIERVFNEPKLLKELSEKSLKKSKEFDGEKIEKREAEIYQELIKGK